MDCSVPIGLILYRERASYAAKDETKEEGRTRGERDTTSAWEQTVNILFMHGQGRRRTKGRGRYQTQATQAE